MIHKTFGSFSLSDDIQKSLRVLDYKIPTEVQERVMPLALEKNDLIVKAKTGSGKTAAYAIPICEMVNWLENKPQALILTPTRELAVQVKEDFTNIGRFKRIKAAAIYGGHPFAAQKMELKQKTHVAVGTPGRVIDHIRKGTLPLNMIRFLVIDEADRMLDMGFIDQVKEIIKELPEDRVTMLFSATMPQEIKDLSLNERRTPVQVDILEESGLAADIDHSLFITSEEDKFGLLTDITVMENPDSCIIFCSTKDRVDLLWEQLKKMNYRPEKLHGGMEQADRNSVIRRFKRGQYRYLVATDVAARGIDVDHISLVINYDIPLEAETYVHRTGRTGRAGHKGKAVSLVTPTQDRFIRQIEEFVGFQIKERAVYEKAEVLKARLIFDKKINEAPEIKQLKSDQLNKGIMKLRFNAGKKKKLRAASFVGVLSNLEGMTPEDIGIITIQDTLTYVEILNGKGPMVLEAMNHTTINGKQLKVIKALDKY
ncbi:DEAD/DEAH box helicase [Lacrimispora amygdalina]|uniref:DEAD/DEAH box helicase n=1 Tax=Lacrimispora amygdalina TaxID=253257 RepID=UPI000BE35458|nr:DEAD/DEAH box helicase [Lacrimispora amygdalina]